MEFVTFNQNFSIFSGFWGFASDPSRGFVLVWIPLVSGDGTHSFVPFGTNSWLRPCEKKTFMFPPESPANTSLGRPRVDRGFSQLSPQIQFRFARKQMESAKKQPHWNSATVDTSSAVIISLFRRRFSSALVTPGHEQKVNREFKPIDRA